MDRIINFIHRIIFWALALGVAGTLVDATIAMRSKAIDAHLHQTLSHSWWTHQLLSPPKKSK
jgi:hypothetical protein